MSPAATSARHANSQLWCFIGDPPIDCQIRRFAILSATGGCPQKPRASERAPRARAAAFCPEASSPAYRQAAAPGDATWTRRAPVTQRVPEVWPGPGWYVSAPCREQAQAAWVAVLDVLRQQIRADDEDCGKHLSADRLPIGIDLEPGAHPFRDRERGLMLGNPAQVGKRERGATDHHNEHHRNEDAGQDQHPPVGQLVV